MRHLSFAAFAHQRHGGALVTAAVIFALGIAVGAMVRPSTLPESAGSFDTARAAVASGAEPAASVGTNSHKFDLETVYPAEVVRIIDGDTFQARVLVWPGLSVDTKVRLRGIDAPELHARCTDEYAKAQAARAALETMLAAGGVTISRVESTSMAAASMLLSPPATRRTFPQRCSMVAGRAATMAAGAAVGADYWTTTGVPTLTRPMRSLTSSLNMRMQPWETKRPINFGWLVREWRIRCPRASSPPRPSDCAGSRPVLRPAGSVFAPDDRRRRPSGVTVFAADGGRARPLHAGAPDADRIADRFAAAEH